MDTQTVRANGIRLAYRAWGSDDAPPGAAPAVLLHCRGADSTDWDWIASPLSAARRVYALDLRGHGRSDWPGTYTYESMRDDVLAFLTVLGIERVDLVGHSLGGAAAYLLAQQHPERVRRLVLEDVPAPFPLNPPRPPAERRDADLPFDWAMVLQTDEQRNTPDPVWWEHMGRITMPTLLVGGGPTSLIPQDHIAVLADRLPDTRLVTIDAGHLVHETRPKEFLAAVEAFLGD
ncbi:alpha/beta fold hydrolase [Streptomyces himalayensis]|uniref:Alpha/beta hydrolase n=1 Tax=Streptomyces himalayensis subsp. himalayensis TaxID=2756131 RepID=A0A7W0DM38_9ACTN|nr:alpha/beta hydrolase [Streptomyces himalayensis]MBA2947515.1 alpha/beta hydrolase [Streptomyces himalayensis subsp. himalayensis]